MVKIESERKWKVARVRLGPAHKCKLPPIKMPGNTLGDRFKDGTKWQCYFGKCRQTWVIKNAKWVRL